MLMSEPPMMFHLSLEGSTEAMTYPPFSATSPKFVKS